MIIFSNNLLTQIKQQMQQGKQIEYFLQTKYNNQTQTLNLNGCRSAIIAEVLKHRKWNQLRRLFLGYSSMHAGGWNINVQMLASMNFDHLQQLILRNAGITSLVLKELIKTVIEPHMRYLTFLNIGYNLIASQGAKCLSKIQLPSLRGLHANECCIGYEGIKHLFKGKWPSLQEIELCKYFHEQIEGNYIENSLEEQIAAISWNYLKIFKIGSSVVATRLMCVDGLNLMQFILASPACQLSLSGHYWIENQYKRLTIVNILRLSAIY